MRAPAATAATTPPGRSRGATHCLSLDHLTLDAEGEAKFWKRQVTTLFCPNAARNPEVDSQAFLKALEHFTNDSARRDASRTLLTGGLKARPGALPDRRARHGAGLQPGGIDVAGVGWDESRLSVRSGHPACSCRSRAGPAHTDRRRMTLPTWRPAAGHCLPQRSQRPNFVRAAPDPLTQRGQGCRQQVCQHRLVRLQAPELVGDQARTRQASPGTDLPD